MTTQVLGFERTGQAKLGSSKQGFTYSETYDYIVMSNDPNEALWDVLTTPGLPLVFVTDQGGLRCTSKTASRDPNLAIKWKVTCEFTSETTGQDTGNEPDPEDWVPIWTGTLESYGEVLQESKYADGPTFASIEADEIAYVNSAKCKYPEPLIINTPIVVMEFAQYEPYVLSVATIAARNDVINDATFKGFTKWTLKCNIKSFTKGLYFGYPKTLINYTVSYKPNNWANKPLDMGYEHYKVAGDAERVASDKIISLSKLGVDLGGDEIPVCNRWYFPNGETSFSAFIR